MKTKKDPIHEAIKLIGGILIILAVLILIPFVWIDGFTYRILFQIEASLAVLVLIVYIFVRGHPASGKKR